MKTLLVFTCILTALTSGSSVIRAGDHEPKQYVIDAKELHRDMIVRLLAKAQYNEAKAQYYTTHPTMDEMKRPMSGRTAAHCRWLAERYRAQAEKVRKEMQTRQPGYTSAQVRP